MVQTFCWNRPTTLLRVRLKQDLSSQIQNRPLHTIYRVKLVEIPDITTSNLTELLLYELISSVASHLKILYKLLHVNFRVWNNVPVSRVQYFGWWTVVRRLYDIILSRIRERSQLRIWLGFAAKSRGEGGLRLKYAVLPLPILYCLILIHIYQHKKKEPYISCDKTRNPIDCSSGSY